MNNSFFQGFPTEGLAKKVFYWQAPILLLSTLVLCAEYLVLRTQDPLLANTLYPARVEYILASLCILLGSVLLAAIHERDLCEK